MSFDQAALDKLLNAMICGDHRARWQVDHYYNMILRPLDIDDHIRSQLNYRLTFLNHHVKMGNGWAMACLGSLYQNGRRFVAKKSLKRAVNLYMESTALNNSLGQGYLGWCHLQGTGVNVDMKVASELLQKSANQGDPMGQRGLALLALKTNKPALRTELLGRAADLGDPLAYKNLICGGGIYGNPFDIYLPRHRDISISRTAKTATVTTEMGSLRYGMSTDTREVVRGFQIYVRYTGPFDIGPNRVVSESIIGHDREMHLNNWRTKERARKICGYCWWKAPFWILCCPLAICMSCAVGDGTLMCCKDEEDDQQARFEIADGLVAITWEQKLAQMLREADDVIDARIRLAGNGHHSHDVEPKCVTAPVSIDLSASDLPPGVVDNDGPTVMITEDRFKELMAGATRAFPPSLIN